MSEIRVAVKIDDDPPVKGGMVMGAPNGAPGPLDGSGKLPAGQVPATGGSDPTALHSASNLSDVASASAARTNLGLGTAATHPAGDFATPADISALSSVYVAQGQIELDLGKQPGVDITGTTECGTAVQTALDAAAAAGQRAFARGTIKTATTLKTVSNADLDDLTLGWVGPSNGVAFQVGSGVSGDKLYYKTIKAPHVENWNKTTTGWAQTGVAGTTGVLVVNAYACKIDVPHVKGFESGLCVKGVGTGAVYNNIGIGFLDNNKRNLWLTADATGWVNQGAFRGGFYHHDSGEGTNVSGTRQILIDNDASPENGNVFTDAPSVEGDTAEYHLDTAGQSDLFDGVRWEVTGGARVKWATGAVNNVIYEGYNAHKIVETFEGGAGSSTNTIISRTSRIRRAPGTNGIVAVYENVSSSAYPVFAIMEAGAAAANKDPATQYLWQQAGTMLRGKAAGDAADRVQIDPVNGKIGFGDGTNAITQFLRKYGTQLGIEGASLLWVTDAAYDIGQYATARPGNIYAATALYIGAAGVATSGSTVKTSGPLRLTSAYWDGAASVNEDLIVRASRQSVTPGDYFLLAAAPIKIQRPTGATLPTLMLKLLSGQTTDLLQFWDSSEVKMGGVTAAGAFYGPKRVTAVASSATPTPNCGTTDVYKVTALAVAATVGAPTGTATDGQELTIRVKDNGTARALSWNAAYRFGTLTAPTTTVISKTMYLRFVWNSDDSVWDNVWQSGGL